MVATEIFKIVILLGMIQGFVVSALLFFRQEARLPNYLLAVLLFLMALASFCLYGWFNDWFGSDTLRFLSNLVPLIIVMPFGPLIFFYVKASLYPGFKLGAKQRVHFYPVFIDIIPQLAAIIFVLGVQFGVLVNNPGPWVSFIDNYNVYSDIPRWVSVTVYLWFSEKTLSKYKADSENMQQRSWIKWLSHFVRIFLVFQLIWLLYLVPYVIPSYTNFMLDTFDWYPVYVPLAILIYWLGIKGYSMSFQPGFSARGRKTVSQPLAKELITESIVRLQKVMEDNKLYLDPGLNLQRLSAHAGIPPKTISAVLNQYLHKSFNEFVNGYRIDEVKTSMLKFESRQLTIAALAFNAGFNSVATFQRAFKASENMTPKEFLSFHKKSTR